MNTKFNVRWLMLVAASVWSTFTARAQGPPPPPPPGANYSQGGFGGAGYPSGVSAAPSFNIYTGSLHREVRDLEVWGGVGEHPLGLPRHYNSRANTTSTTFGNANWRHSYQWQMADNGADLNIYYPDGTCNKFTDVGGSKWTSTAAVPDVLWVPTISTACAPRRAGNTSSPS